jgi:catechol 2,3-dioxygenase-like lactoylglutathione lyase family enzyme
MIPKRLRERGMNPRISMITLGVRDLAASVQFYEDGLGFPRMESPPEVAFFTLNGTWLGLYGREALAADATVSPQGGGFESFALAHNVHSEAEVDEIIRQAVEAGAALVKTPAKTSWGGYSGYFTDPDGHLWEIAHNPFFWVGPDDDSACQTHSSCRYADRTPQKVRRP